MRLADTILAAVVKSEGMGDRIALIEVQPDAWALLRIEQPLDETRLVVEGEGWGTFDGTPIRAAEGVEGRYRLLTLREVRARAQARRAEA